MSELGVEKPRLKDAVNAVRRWPARRWLVTVVTGLLTALAVGIPTGVIPNPLYSRMTPVQWWNYPILAATVVLAGLVFATYVRPVAGNGTRAGGVTGGGLLSALAVGCPVCNKVVVAAMGASGALNLWAPLQPLLGLAALALLGYALARRLAGEISCPVSVA